ncbi:MAG: gamma-glutamyltransferase [Bacteroidota bacterium]|nr:gamma-glutamyltransferase [Bacteroidota bacterium]
MSRYFILTVLLAAILTGCISKSFNPKSKFAEGRNIVADSGMVVSAHPESSKIGVTILLKGGNAVDAAVATEFALAVCYPVAGNIGGGGFMLIRLADGTTDMIDYREKAPLLASRDMYLDPSGNVAGGLSTDTHLASGVPGTVDGMVNVHSKYGVLPFREVIQPAIDLARKGFSVSAGQARDLNSNRENFIKRNASLPRFVKVEPWKAGDTLRQPELAMTLERIRDKGRDGFYSGLTARLIVKEMKRGNGIISEQDLAVYTAKFRDPLSRDYRGYKIISVSPPSGGGVILFQILGMVEPFNLGRMGFHTWQSVHLMTEAERRAFADRSQYLGDPDFIEVPVNEIIDRGYLNKRMSNYNNEAASPSELIKPGSLVDNMSEETTHYSVVDRMGNAVASTTTLNGGYGNSIVVDSAGFLMNNQMDDFSLKPGTPNMYGLTGGEANSIQPGKRMLSSMTPVIIEKDNRLFMVAGSPGGSTIPTSVFQVITNVIDFGMDIGQAVDTGRFHHQWQPDVINYETNSLDSATVSKLKSMGHRLVERSAIGRVNAILVLSDGRKKGGADRRGDNISCGY